VGEKFFTEWEKSDLPELYLYISRADKIENVIEQSYSAFGTNEKLARKAQKKFEKEHCHTMLYKTYGTSATLLTKKLMSYPPETIAFIAFHESFHIHRNKSGKKIPYSFEESTCDLLGNYGLLLFAEKTGMIEKDLVQRQITLHEKIYSCINNFTAKAEASKPEEFGFIYSDCEKQLKVFISEGNKFHCDRYDYKVNNAYFLRYQSYYKNYFLLRELKEKSGGINSLLEKVLSLPEKEVDALKLLVQ
jgi:hypothetical protein